MLELSNVAGVIRSSRDRMSVSVVDKMFREKPELQKKYSDLYERLVIDVQFHFDYLGQAVQYSSTKLLEDYASWMIVFFKDINVPVSEIAYTFRLMQEELKNSLDIEVSNVATKYIETVIDSLHRADSIHNESFIESSNPLKVLALEYMDLLLHQRRQEALNLLLKAIETGTTVKDIYLFVIQKSLHELGRIWQISRVSVAEEHCFTASTQLIIAQLYPYLFTGRNQELKVLASCVGRELHEIGMRMVADFFEMDGWDSIYVGANTPTKTLIQMVKTERPDLLALSVTIIPHLKNLREIISSLREDKSLNSTKIIVGGYPFNVERDLWKKFPVDGYAPDAESAVEVANKLFSVKG